MVEKLKEAKELIKAGKYDEAISTIDEVIANTPDPSEEKTGKSTETNEPDDIPMPGTGSNGMEP